MEGDCSSTSLADNIITTFKTTSNLEKEKPRRSHLGSNEEKPIQQRVETDENNQNNIDWIHGDPDPDDNIDDNLTDLDSPAMLQWFKRKHPKPVSKKEKISQNLTVLAAVCAGVIVSLVKFAAAAITGSVAMLAEGVHSLVDAGNDSLLLVGTKASKKDPDIEHPFGYGQELFFYTFVVGVVIFIMGGCFTIYQGVSSLYHGGSPIENPMINYIVLLAGILIEGVSFRIAAKDVMRSKGNQSLRRYIRESKDPRNFTVLLEDSAAIAGMVIAMLGVFMSDALGLIWADAVASIIIGAVMATIALVLLRETRSLLIGEGLGREDIEDIVFIVEDDPAVIKCGRVLTVYFGPESMLMNLDVTFDDELDEGDILQAVDRIERELMDEYPQTTSIFIEAESLNLVYRQRRERTDAFKADEEEDEMGFLERLIGDND